MMLSKANPTQLITVLPVGMDPRKLSVFRMAFRMHHSHQSYQLLDESPGYQPDLAIVDVDSVEGWNAWHDFRASHPHLPALIVTTSPPSEAPAAVLRKPVRVETLFPQMRELLTQTSPTARASMAPAQIPLPATRTPDVAAATPTGTVSAAAAYMASVAPNLEQLTTQSQQAHRAVEAARQRQLTPTPASDLPQLMDLPDAEEAVPAAEATQRSTPPVGQPKPASTDTNPDGGKISFERFDPHAGLFGMVARLLRQRSAAVIRVREIAVMVLLPAQDKALLLQPLDSLQALCSVPSHEVDQQPYASKQLPLAVQEIRPQPLVWQLAVWTSRGRLMRGIAPDTPLRLRYWPNLTRLAPIPEAMRITAFLTRTPVNLKLITRLLKVPPEHLFNYLAAAYGIGILDIPQRNGSLSVISTEPIRPGVSKADTSNHTVASAPATTPAKPAAANSGLLSRLLKKVIGL